MDYVQIGIMARGIVFRLIVQSCSGRDIAIKNDIAGSLGRRGTARSAGTTTRSTAVGVGHTATGIVGRGRADRLAERLVNAKAEPAQQSAFDAAPEQDVLDEGITGRGFLGQNAVSSVCREGLRVDFVHGRGLNFGNQVLIEEHLSDVRGAGVEQCSVGLSGGCGHMHHDVDVGCSPGVVAREHGLELHAAVAVGLLDAAHESRVQVGGVAGAVSVARCRHAAVHACRVAVCRGELAVSLVGVGHKETSRIQLTPDFEIGICHGLAGLGVQDLDIQGQIDTRLLVDNVLADVLAGHV
jgi:hypothetical protein